jgi:hypothetical protein
MSSRPASVPIAQQIPVLFSWVDAEFIGSRYRPSIECLASRLTWGEIMPKWLLRLLLILLLAIEAMHFISPGAIPNWLVITIMIAVIAVTVVFIQIGRQKELEQIRDELQKLRRELAELREKQGR